MGIFELLLLFFGFNALAGMQKEPVPQPARGPEPVPGLTPEQKEAAQKIEEMIQAGEFGEFEVPSSLETELSTLGLSAEEAAQLSAGLTIGEAGAGFGSELFQLLQTEPGIDEEQAFFEELGEFGVAGEFEEFEGADVPGGMGFATVEDTSPAFFDPASIDPFSEEALFGGFAAGI
jgi:hypothetical protein